MIAAALAMLAVAGAGAADEPPAPATPEQIVAYRESGEWVRDTQAVNRRALAALRRRLDAPRPTLVLDVDDTALSSYACLRAVDFVRAGTNCGAAGDMPAIGSTLRLFRFARRNGVAVVFLTGRAEPLRAVTAANLRAAGYTGRWGLIMRAADERGLTAVRYKTRERRALARAGRRIVVDVGDQRSDLRGRWSGRTFKLPNPMYVIR
jgi:HAD superfamily, subfamily IIIB (Acid phosphatase)